MNAIPERLQRHIALFRIESKQAVHSGRPIRPLSASYIPGPTACTTQTLGFGQIGIAASQLPLRLLCNGNVGHRAHKLDIAGRISHGASHRLDIFHRPIRHKQSMFLVEILSVAGRAIDGRLHGSAILRMGTLNYEFHGRYNRRVASKNSESLV